MTHHEIAKVRRDLLRTVLSQVRTRCKSKDNISLTPKQLLKVCWCSKAQAWQRAGRAGRESSGNVYRLYTDAQFAKMNDSTIPEIQRSPLANVCLQVPVVIVPF